MSNVNTQWVMVLILRYLGIWVYVGAPFMQGVPGIHTNTPFSQQLFAIGLGGVGFVMFGIAVPAIRHFLTRYFHLPVVVLIGCVVALFYCWMHQLPIGSLGLVTFLMLGVATACCEARSIHVAASGTEEGGKASGLKLFNGLKVAGLGLGFVFGSLLASGGQLVLLSITVSGLSLLLLAAIALMIACAGKDLPASASLPGAECNPWNFTKVMSVVLIVLDVALFNFWYIFLPARLFSEGFDGQDIAFLLALQCMAHLFGQVFWHRLVERLGCYPTFVLSYSLHLLMVALLSTLSFGLYGSMGLFAAMGLVNSGTFLASGLLLYKSGNVTVGDNYQHLAASYFGRFLGAWI